MNNIFDGSLPGKLPQSISISVYHHIGMRVYKGGLPLDSLCTLVLVENLTEALKVSTIVFTVLVNFKNKCW